MNSITLVKTFPPPPFDKKEIMRYAGCKTADSEISNLINTCVDEIKEKLVYKVCYRTLPVKIGGKRCEFGTFALYSKRLADTLSGCDEVILFAATVGVEIDRLITKYGRLSPSKAVIFQAIGAERIETLCNTFCADISKDTAITLTTRFSPGYGDLPLDSQREIFAVLDCNRKIGLTLNDSLLMSPTKSVTAFIGIKKY